MGRSSACWSTGDAKYLYLAGLDRPDEAYTDAILRTLVESEPGRYLYLAGKNWPE